MCYNIELIGVKMKLSQETISTLLNFSKISPQMKIHAGKVQSIKNNSVCLAYVTVEEDFPIDFCVYDLSEFISMLSLVKDAELQFNEKYVSIKSGTQEIKYYNTEESFVKNSDAKDVLKNVPEFEINFDLTKGNMESILRGVSVFKSNVITFEIEPLSVTSFVSSNEDSDTSNNLKILIDDKPQDGGRDCLGQVSISVENWKIPPNDYTVFVSSKGLCKFESKDGKSTYYIAINKKRSTLEAI